MRKLTAAEQLTVRRIMELAAQGKKIRTIIATINFEGHRNKNGGPWARRAVERVLKQTFSDAEKVSSPLLDSNKGQQSNEPTPRHVRSVGSNQVP